MHLVEGLRGLATRDSGCSGFPVMVMVMVHEKRSRRQKTAKGWPAGSPKTASYSSRCYWKPYDEGDDVGLRAAPPPSKNRDPRQVGGVRAG